MSAYTLKDYKRLVDDSKADFDVALRRYVAACTMYEDARRKRKKAKRG